MANQIFFSMKNLQVFEIRIASADFQRCTRNKDLQVDFLRFTFTALGKKVSMGYATGTAPEAFSTGM